MTVEVATEERREAERSRLSYRTPRSGHLVVVTTPDVDPLLWQEYLAGARQRYGAYGVVHALDIDQVADGGSTTLLFVALDDEGTVLGGMRAQGPYAVPEQAQALEPFAGRPDRERVRSMIEERLPAGVVEPKGLWVSRGFDGRADVVDSFGRTPVHAATILGARFVIGLTGEHTEALWASSGAVAPDLAPLPFPDDRYETRLIWWDRWSPPPWMSDTARRAADAETAQLIGPFVPRPRPSP